MKPQLYVITLAGLVGMATLPSHAWAQQSGEEEAAPSAEDIKAAAEAFDLGRRAFKSKDYVEAAENFESADSHAPSAAALELAFRSRDKAGQLDRAATLAWLAKKRHPDADFVKKLVPPVLKRAQSELHEATVKCDLPCEIVVETKLAHGKPDVERVIYLAPGQHNIRAGWSMGRSQSQSVDATAGGHSDLSFTAPPEPKQEAAPAASGAGAGAGEAGNAGQGGRVDRGVQKHEGWPPIIFFIGAGATAVLGGVTIWSGVDTLNNPGPDTVKQECVNRNTDCPAYQQGLAHQTRTNVLIAVTAGVGVATLLIGAFATDWSSMSSEQQPASARKRAVSRGASVEPWITTGNGVTLGGAVGRF